MFDERQTQAYQNIKAPEALYNKIKAKRKNYSWAVIAACLVCVLMLSVFLTPEKTEIKVNGVVLEDSLVITESSPQMRSTLISIAVKIETNKKTEVSVSKGYIKSGDVEGEKMTFDQACEFCWMTDAKDIPAEIKISDDKGVTTYTLIYEDSQYILKKEK